jgi:predicted MFS family arabinose efflux permease
MLQLLRVGEFRAMFAALAISMVGDSMMLTIPAILVRKGSGSNAAAGFEVLFFTLPICLAPMAGPFIDRFRRRPLLVVVSCLSAVSLLPLLAVTTPGYWWTGYVVAAFLGCSYVSTSAGVSGLLPQIAPAELLGHANSLLQSFRQGVRLIGPLVGIFLYARLGIGAVTAADACSFVVAAGIFGFLKVPEPAPEPRPKRGVADFSLGARFLYQDGPLRAVTASTMLFAVTAGAAGAATYAVVTVGLGQPPEFVGVLTSVMGVGAIAGGFLSGRLITRLGELGAVGIGVLAYSTAIAGLTMPSPVTAIPAMALAGVGVTLPAAGRLTILQRRTPAERMARVSFALDSVANTAQLVTMASCASLLAVVSFRYLLLPAALIGAAGGLRAVLAPATAPAPAEAAVTGGPGRP